MVNNDAAIFESNEANKQADSSTHRDPQIPGDADQHPLSQSRNGEKDEQDACDKDGAESGLP